MKKIAVLAVFIFSSLFRFDFKFFSDIVDSHLIHTGKNTL